MLGYHLIARPPLSLAASVGLVKLHAKLLSNYKAWARQLRQTPQCAVRASRRPRRAHQPRLAQRWIRKTLRALCQTAAVAFHRACVRARARARARGCAAQGESDISQNKATDLVLCVLIWGEAANLRHVPESLCFLFHKMREELWRAAVVNNQSRPAGWFLSRVIAPLYRLMRTEMNKKDAKGKPLGHTRKCNYDECAPSRHAPRSSAIRHGPNTERGPLPAPGSGCFAPRRLRCYSRCLPSEHSNARGPPPRLLSGARPRPTHISPLSYYPIRFPALSLAPLTSPSLTTPSVSPRTLLPRSPPPLLLPHPFPRSLSCPAHFPRSCPRVHVAPAQLQRILLVDGVPQVPLLLA